MYNIDITGPAEQDIRKAVEYIDTELQNRIAAENLLDDIENAILSLSEMPLRHSLVADKALASQGFRFVPVNNYLVFYIVRESRKTVVIERVIYKKRNWATILKEEK
jgi:plasmid stabilization system protein ParE